MTLDCYKKWISVLQRNFIATLLLLVEDNFDNAADMTPFGAGRDFHHSNTEDLCSNGSNYQNCLQMQEQNQVVFKNIVKFLYWKILTHIKSFSLQFTSVYLYLVFFGFF